MMIVNIDYHVGYDLIQFYVQSIYVLYLVTCRYIFYDLPNFQYSKFHSNYLAFILPLLFILKNDIIRTLLRVGYKTPLVFTKD